MTGSVDRVCGHAVSTRRVTPSTGRENQFTRLGLGVCYDLSAQFFRRTQNMDAEAPTLASVARSNTVSQEFKTVAIFCGLGLLFSLVAVISYDVNFGAF